MAQLTEDMCARAAQIHDDQRETKGHQMTTQNQLQREIAAHNAAVEARKAAKKARKAKKETP